MGAAPTRSWTSSPRRSWPPGAASLVPIPTYAMYGVLTAQRGARSLAVPRLGAADGFAIDLPGHPRAAAGGRTSSGCARPTTRPGAPSRGGDRWPSWTPPPGSRAADRPSSSTRPTSSSGPARSSRCATRYPTLIVVRTAVQGLRPARPARRLRRRGTPDHRAAGAPPAARQRLHGLGGGRRGGPAPPGAGGRQRRAAGRRARLAGRAAGGHGRLPPYPSVTNFLLVRIGDPRRRRTPPSGCCGAASCRAPSGRPTRCAGTCASRCGPGAGRAAGRGLRRMAGTGGRHDAEARRAERVRDDARDAHRGRASTSTAPARPTSPPASASTTTC